MGLGHPGSLVAEQGPVISNDAQSFVRQQSLRLVHAKLVVQILLTLIQVLD